MELTAKSILSRGVSASALVSVTGIGLQFLLQLVLARGLGVDGFGQYSYIMSWVLIAMLVAVLGMDSIFLRFIPGYVADDRRGLLHGLLSAGSRAVLGASLVMVAVAGIVISQLMQPGERQDAFLVGFLLLPLLSLNTLRQATLRAFKRVVMARSPELLVQPLVFAGLFLLYWKLVPENPPTPVLALVMLGVALSASFIIGLIFARQVVPGDLSATERQYDSRTWIDMSMPMILSAAFFVVAAEVDKIMVGMLIGDAAVGQYAMASRIAILVLFGLQTVNVIAVPMISEYHASRTPSELQQLTSRITALIFMITIPVFVGVVLLGEPVLGLLGEEFSAAYMALVILACGQLVNAATGPAGFLLTMTGHHKASLKIVSLTLGMNILLNIPAIWYFGINGAAAVTAFSIALRNLLSWQYARTVIGVDSAIFSALVHRKV